MTPWTAAKFSAALLVATVRADASAQPPELEVSAWSHASAAAATLPDGKFNTNTILCPVLTAMYRAGDLKTDEHGLVEIADLMHGFTKIGARYSIAFFQTFGIMDYTKEEALKKEGRIRDRCLPLTLSGAWCFARRALSRSSVYATPTSERLKRYIPLFDMNGDQNLEHGFSTGTRGGALNLPTTGGACNGNFPCYERFRDFYLGSMKDGRLYRKQILHIICKARVLGDRGGEFSYYTGAARIPGFDISLPAESWQMKGAMSAMLDAFGEKDEHGELYMTEASVRALLMEGRYPDGWWKRPWGCITGCDRTLATIVNEPVGECEVGENEPWWPNSECQVSSGERCNPLSQGLWNSCAHVNGRCVNGLCLCDRDSSLVAKCFSTRHGKCMDRQTNYTYFGETPRRIAASHPGTGENNQDEVYVV